MSYIYIIYPDPVDMLCVGVHDDLPGQQFVASPTVGPTGRQGQRFIFPESMQSGHGFAITYSHPSTVVVITQKGALYVDNGQAPFTYLPGCTAGVTNDDMRLPIIAPCPDVPVPVPPGSIVPLDIINQTYSSGHYVLATKDGCGKFTEDCGKNLHDLNSKFFGMVKKNPGQNQYNGHAVDAVMLLFASGDTKAGIYDIIINSESDQAKPAFNYAGPPDGSLWYYPPA